MAGQGTDGRRRRDVTAGHPGFVNRDGTRELAAYTWPAPSSVISGGRRWPQAEEFDTDDPRLRAGTAWLHSISAAVRTERFARGLSREQLSDLARVSYNAIKDLESGLRWPSWQTLASVCAALHLDIAVSRSHGDQPSG